MRRYWPVERLRSPPPFMVAGVPQEVQNAGANLINPDRMWHYTEGIRNWNPIWPNHRIRILPGPSILWLDPSGKRIPFPHIPGASPLDILQQITTVV